MKLRIRGDSLRLRLTRGEIDQFRESGLVEEVMHVAPGQSLTYAIELDEGAAQPTASLAGTRVRVGIPASHARHWVDSDEVGIETRQGLADGQDLRILIEKDFKCLTTREGEDDSDAFANPNESC